MSELLVNDSTFPSDWFASFPEDTSTDPITNHVGRIWGHMSGAKAEQAIWRAYTVSDAQVKYKELRNRGLFQPSPDLLNDPDFAQFVPPSEINFQSEVADEFYLVCGRWGWAYCEVVARYRNYVVDIRMDLKAALEGEQANGLTYEEIETVIRVMDTKFMQSLDTLPTPSP